MPEMARQSDVTGPADRPGLLAPDTSGYRADPALTDLLRIHLPDALFFHIEPHLDRLGALAGGHLDECARLADRHVPMLHQRDRFGRDAQWIEYHPAYRELERAAFGEFGIHAMSLRKGVMGWPAPYPVVAIGGISLERLPAVRACGVQGVAVVSAVTLADDPQAAVRQALALSA